jgi:hypothetical protein
MGKRRSGFADDAHQPGQHNECEGAGIVTHNTPSADVTYAWVSIRFIRFTAIACESSEGPKRGDGAVSVTDAGASWPSCPEITPFGRRGPAMLAEPWRSGQRMAQDRP